MKKLALAQRKTLIKAMTELFTTLDELTAFIRDNTGRNVQEIVVGALPITRSRLVDNAEAFEWLPELLEALKEIAGPDMRATLETIDVTSNIPKPETDSFRATVSNALSTDDLLRILHDRLGKDVAAGNIDAAVAEMHFVALAKAVRGQSAGNPALRQPLEQLGLLTQTPTNLQNIVNEANSLLDLGPWLARLTSIEGWVCRVGYDTPVGLKSLGSGVLVGPSTVLTNHHVVRTALAPNELDPKKLRVQFDYRVLKDGSIDAGTIVELDHSTNESWRLDFAPHSALDGKVHPITEEPEAEKLDYALLRLAKPVGSLPIGPVSDSSAAVPARRWLDLTEHGPKSKPDTAAFIVQHPLGLPIKLALETKGVIGYSPNERRIRYRANTMGGSSGSPVFNQDLEIIALHHAGDPAYPFLEIGDYNEGIPVPALLKQFDARGVLQKLST